MDSPRFDLLERTAGRAGRPLVFGRSDNQINFVSAMDVAALVERMITDPSTSGRTLQIGGPQDLSLNELAAAVQRAAGRGGCPPQVPRTALRIMAAALRPFNPTWLAIYPDLLSTTLADLLAERASGFEALEGPGRNDASIRERPSEWSLGAASSVAAWPAAVASSVGGSCTI